MEVSTALHRLGGVSDLRGLLALVARAELEDAVAAGKVLHPARNLYALPVTDAAVVGARRVHGVVSHLSAALAWGWKVKQPPDRPIVSVARHRHPEGKATEGLDVRFAVLPADDVADGRTTRARTVLDCCRSLPFDEALAVCDSALRSRSVTREQLCKAAIAGPRTGRQVALRVIAASDGRAANPFESALRAIALDVPGFCAVAQGAVGPWHADVADLALRIAVEAESFEFHALPEAFRHDIRRYTDMVRRGWLVMRFTWEDVMHKPQVVRAALIDVVALRHASAA